MTILIIGYVVTVVLAAYFVNSYARTASTLEMRLRNYKTWLDEANEDQFAKGDALRAAYRTVDRYEALLRDKYNHWDHNQSLPEDDVVNEFSSAINDNVACAGVYYDDGGNPCIDKLDWTPQEGVTYSESDESDV